MLDGDRIVIEGAEWWNEEALAKRLAYFIEGDWGGTYMPYKKENGSWQLDAGNDWFLYKDSTGRMVLHTRYWDTKELQSLDTVLHKLYIGRKQ